MAKTMLFYNTVAPLLRDQHRKLKFKPFTSAKFAAESNLIPIAGQEFINASLDYPILFVKEKDANGKDRFVPLVLLGMVQGKNDFVDAKGQWLPSTYLPAFVRRYPFVLAKHEAEGAKPEYTVCIDTDCDNFNEKEGTSLFDDKGEATQFLNEQINFLNAFNAEMIRTTEFGEKLSKLNVMDSQPISVQAPNGTRVNLTDFWIINPEKFAKVPAKELEEMNKNGTLGWIFYHYASLNNLTRIMDRHVASAERTTTKDKKA